MFARNRWRVGADARGNKLDQLRIEPDGTLAVLLDD